MACEKCWSDAYGMMMRGECESQSEGYRRLIGDTGRKRCTPEEECGVGTTEMHTIHLGHTSCACGLRKEKL